jgi:hypothetical protein
MLRVEPAARRRLEQIAANLAERIEEAKANGWLGEVDGLQTSLHAAHAKLTALDRATRRTTVPLGLPTAAVRSPE